MARSGQVVDDGAEQIEFLVCAADSDGRLLKCRVRSAVGRPAPPEHSHPRSEERFIVEAGRLGYVLGSIRHEAQPGDVVVVPPATNHTFWNAGEDELVVTTEVRPALRFEDFAETIHVLIRDGHIAAGGKRSNPLRLAVVAQTYPDEWRFTGLSPVARALLPLMALVGRLAGYRGYYPSDGATRRSVPATV